MSSEQQSLSSEQQAIDWRILPRVTIEPRKRVAKPEPRKQCLMRSGLKFYYVYEDDGSLVEGQYL